MSEQPWCCHLHIQWNKDDRPWGKSTWTPSIDFTSVGKHFCEQFFFTIASTLLQIDPATYQPSTSIRPPNTELSMCKPWACYRNSSIKHNLWGARVEPGLECVLLVLFLLPGQRSLLDPVGCFLCKDKAAIWARQCWTERERERERERKGERKCVCERERERERESVCVCVCVREREREREKGRGARATCVCVSERRKIELTALGKKVPVLFDGMCVFVCVREREREGGGGGLAKPWKKKHLYSLSLDWQQLLGYSRKLSVTKKVSERREREREGGGGGEPRQHSHTWVAHSSQRSNFALWGPLSPHAVHRRIHRPLETHQQTACISLRCHEDCTYSFLLRSQGSTPRLESRI